MASRVKIKTVRKTLGNGDIQSMFQQAVGGDGAIDHAVAWPKFKAVRAAVDKAVRLTDWLAGWLNGVFPEEAAAIATYAADLRREHTTLFGGAPDLDAGLGPLERAAETPPDLSAVPTADLELFAKTYGAAMKSDLVNTFIVTCRNLSNHKASLENSAELRGHFLTKAGLAFEPYPDLPAANFKAFYRSRDLTEAERSVLLLFLHKLYKSTHEVYDAVSMPDVDVEKFIEVVMSAMDDVKKHLDCDCNEAFNILRDSVQLLRSNFGSYYRDVQESGNNNALMENFVFDVAKNSGGVTPRVQRQFNRIIAFYRKQAQMAPKSASTQVLFSELERNMQALAQENGEDAEEEEEEEEEEAAPAPADLSLLQRARDALAARDARRAREDAELSMESLVPNPLMLSLLRPTKQ